MASPAMTPERGVDIYYNDPTQGQGSADKAIRDVHRGQVRLNLDKVLHVLSVPLGRPFIEIILFQLVTVKVQGSPAIFVYYVLSVHKSNRPWSPVLGQTRDNQINCLSPILNRLLIGSSKPFKWTFQNGYIFMTNEDFKIINDVLKNMKKEEIEELKSLLEVGIHWNVEVNDNSVTVSSLQNQMI